MPCLHFRFRVIKHHIGSGSNPDLGPDVPGRLLNLWYVWFLFSFGAEFILLLLTLANGKSSFALPRLFNNKFDFHPFLKSLPTAALFWYVHPFFCWLCEESKCRTISESVHDWVGRVNHWESCKRLNYDHTNK